MTTTRRDFLATLGVALAAPPLRLPRFNAVSTGAKLNAVGIQLYTVRTLMEKDLHGTLAKIAEIGYKEVEFAGYFGRKPAQVRALLATNHLKSPSTHIGFPATDDAWKKAVDESKEIGHDWVVIPWLDAAQRKIPDEWARFAERFNQLASVAKKSGMKFAYHNHDFEFTKVNAGTGLDVLISKTDPQLVDFEMDIYWVVKGGRDPLALIDKYPGRFPLMHAKDATAAPDRTMMDVGKGTIDFAGIFAQSKKSGMKHVYVEHDQPADALQSAMTSYRYLSS